MLEIAPDAEILLMMDLNSPNWLVRRLASDLRDSMLGITNALTTRA